MSEDQAAAVEAVLAAARAHVAATAAAAGVAVSAGAVERLLAARLLHVWPGYSPGHQRAAPGGPCRPPKPAPRPLP